MATHRELHIAFTCAAALVAAMACAPAARAGLSLEEGIARDTGGDGLLYVEQHLVRREGGRPLERLVVYRCADGTPFARKQVDYRQSVLAPAFSLEDARMGYREGLRRTRGPGEVFVREETGAAERAAALDPMTGVADAGFDEFVRQHWDALMAGESVPLHFAVPSRLESLGFRIRRVGDAVVAGEPAVVLRLGLGGWRGWIAQRIDVAYGRDSRRLLRFEGLGNLRDDRGERQLEARIDFPRPGRPADEALWQRFAREPLSACRVRA